MKLYIYGYLNRVRSSRELENDSKAMGGMVRRTKTILGHNKFTSLYDKGYHTGSEFDYAHRQAIVEHPYGIIKRQWGFNYIMTKKTIKRASADVGFIFISYNLRRLLDRLPLPASIEKRRCGEYIMYFH